jgi:hypothetical protein
LGRAFLSEAQISFSASELAYMDNNDTAYVRVKPVTTVNTGDIYASFSSFSAFYVND